jgi:phosphatidate cytidylyltransferase
LGLYEYYALAKRGGIVQGLIAAIAILGAFYYDQHNLIVIVISVLTIIELLIELFANEKEEDLSGALASAAIKIFGVLYVALLGGYIIAIRIIDHSIPNLGPKLLTLFFMVVFAGDTFAYYAGRGFGRNKLAPRISPGNGPRRLARPSRQHVVQRPAGLLFLSDCVQVVSVLRRAGGAAANFLGAI